MKITNEIFQVGGSGLTSHEDAAIYLVSFDGHAALIDAGCGRSVGKVLANIEKCGVDRNTIEYLLITHCHFDHTGGAGELKDLLRCQAVCHELDAPYLEAGDNEVTAASWYGSWIKPFSVDRKLSGKNENIDLGGRNVRAIHVPGHSPGSVVYLAESDGCKVLFGQDVHGPIDPRLLSDRKQYLKSLKLMLSLEADILCEGHFGVFREKENVKDFIVKYINE